MKKIITLVLALGLVFGAASVSFATDVRVGGVFDFTMGKVWHPGAGEHTNGDWIARERFRTWIDFIVSESLKGQIFLEIGEANFGNWGDHNGQTQNGNGQGFSLGGDGINIEVRRAFFDWIVPNTKLQVRVGLQNIAFPKSNPGPHFAFDDDMAGIVLNYKFNDMVALNLFWARPYDNDQAGFYTDSGVEDTMDIFGFILPITGDGYKVSLYGAYANIGDNVAGFINGNASISGKDGWWNGGDYDYAWWLGTAVNLNIWDPLSIGFDFLYGSWHSDHNNKQFGTNGWLADLFIDYKTSWGTPGLILWYASGDSETRNRQLPRLSSPGNRYLNIGMNDEHAAFGDGKQLDKAGIGTWGIVAQIKDISFIDKMKHLIRIGYVRGTHDKDINTNTIAYLTTRDWAVEIDLLTRYEIYDNLSAFVELGWMHVGGKNFKSETHDDIWKFMVGLQYRF